MIRKIERTWFEIWGTEEAQNRVLKGLLSFVLMLLAIETISLVCLALRRPLVIAVTTEATKVLAASPPQSDILQGEVKRVVTAYMNLRHSWDYSNIETNINGAAKLVGSNYSKRFIQATSEQVKLAKAKKLSQRFYVSNLAIDDKARVVRITGDRILIIDTLRAVNPMTFEIGYEVSDRTSDNPEGVYIISETNLTK